MKVTRWFKRFLLIFSWQDLLWKLNFVSYEFFTGQPELIIWDPCLKWNAKCTISYAIAKNIPARLQECWQLYQSFGKTSHFSVPYGLSNVIIRDRKFAKVCKSKPLLLANFWTKRAKFFLKDQKLAKFYNKYFFKYFLLKNVKILALSGKKPERLVP